MSPARFRWGMILVQIGILILLNNLEILTHHFWADLLVFFPILLIAVGVEKIFTQSRLQFISYLTTVVIFGGGLAIALTSGFGRNEGSFFSETRFRYKHDDSISSIKACLNVKDTDLTIRDSGRDIVRGRFDRFTVKPRIEYDVRDGKAFVSLNSRESSFLGGIVQIDGDEPQDWYLSFSEKAPLDLICQGDGSDLHMNLSTTPLRSLDLDAPDSKIYVKVGDLQPLVVIKIEGDDSSLKLRIPEDVGIRITGNDLESFLDKVGFHPLDEGFVNEGYDDFDSRIEIDLDDRLRSVAIDYF